MFSVVEGNASGRGSGTNKEGNPGSDEDIIVPPETSSTEIFAIETQDHEEEGERRQGPKDCVQLRAEIIVG